MDYLKDKMYNAFKSVSTALDEAEQRREKEEQTGESAWLESSLERKQDFATKMGISLSDRDSFIETMDEHSLNMGDNNYRSELLNRAAMKNMRNGVLFEQNYAAHEALKEVEKYRKGLRENGQSIRGWGDLASDSVSNFGNEISRGAVSLIGEEWEATMMGYEGSFDRLVKTQVDDWYYGEEEAESRREGRGHADKQDYESVLSRQTDTSKTGQRLIHVFDEVDLWYAKGTAQRGREWEGTKGASLATVKWLADTGTSIATFVVGAGVSTVTTGTPIPGLAILIAGHAKVKGDEVYRATGDTGLAITAGVLNGVGTALIFAFAGGMGAKAVDSSLAKMWETLGKEGLKKAASYLMRGETKTLSKFLVGALKIEGLVIGVRNTEFMLTAVYKNLILPDLEAAQYDITIDNLKAVTGHAIQEGAIFIGMPGLMRTVGGIVHVKAARLRGATEGFRVNLHRMMANVNLASLKTLKEYQAIFEGIKTENPYVDVIKQLLDNMVRESEGKERIELVLGEGIKGMSKGEKIKTLKEVNDILKDIFGEVEVVRPEEVAEVAGSTNNSRSRGENTPEHKAEGEKKAQEWLDERNRANRERGKEDIPEGTETRGIEYEKTDAELAYDALMGKPEMDAINKRRTELEEKKKAKDDENKFTKEDAVELKRLEYIKSIHDTFKEMTGGYELGGKTAEESKKYWEDFRKETDEATARHAVFSDIARATKKTITDAISGKLTKTDMKGAIQTYIDSLIDSYQDW